MMQISGRNQLAGTVTRVNTGTTIGEVELDIGGGHTITGIITRRSIDEMKIQEGDKLTALIKSTSVMFMKN